MFSQAALAAWLKADVRVQAAIAQPHCATSVVLLFRKLDRAEFEQALPPLLDACETSPQFARALLDVGMNAFAYELGRKLQKHTSAIIRKALLEILRASLAAAWDPVTLLRAANLDVVLTSLRGNSDQVLVTELAKSLFSSPS